MSTPGFVAGGNITPMSAVKQSTAGNRQVVLATDGSAPIVGVTGKGHRYPPIESWGIDDGFIAKAGEGVELHDTPEEWEVFLGGTVTRGDLLMPNASGYAITHTAGNYYFGYAKDSGVSGDVIKFKLEFGYQ